MIWSSSFTIRIERQETRMERWSGGRERPGKYLRRRACRPRGGSLFAALAATEPVIVVTKEAEQGLQPVVLIVPEAEV